MKTGIYGIYCRKNKRWYVGQTSRAFSLRDGEHDADLEAGTHKNTRLQADYNRYRKKAFEFKVLERGDRNLNQRERHWIIELNAAYNIVWPGGGGLIERDRNGKIIVPTPKENAAALDWGWWWGMMIGAIFGVIWLAA